MFNTSPPCPRSGHLRDATADVSVILFPTFRTMLSFHSPVIDLIDPTLLTEGTMSQNCSLCNFLCSSKERKKERKKGRKMQRKGKGRRTKGKQKG
jgi:hypothetical protein